MVGAAHRPVLAFFCIPYFVVAQFGKRVERRLPVASAVGWGA
jgi:hypothetical protein